jgi:predicted naringenin-chalcone synthase
MTTVGTDSLESAGIIAIGTAQPPSLEQNELAEWMQVTLGIGGVDARRVRRVFGTSPIASRPVAFADETLKCASALYDSGLPDLADRMAAYREVSRSLATRASLVALRKANVGPGEITHLILVSSTGVGMPGPDVYLSRSLGLRANVIRLCLTGQGCSGALHGLAVARGIAELDESARVLVCCVEVCSIHLQGDTGMEGVVVASLFADAAATAIVKAVGSGERCVARLGKHVSHLDFESRDMVTWDLYNHGFEIRLARQLPEIVGSAIGDFLEPLLSDVMGVASPREITSWCVHPGGKSVLDQIRLTLGLDVEALASSYEILNTMGNLSSTTVLFVLDLESRRVAAGEAGIMVGFGPGLSLEAINYETGCGPDTSG